MSGMSIVMATYNGERYLGEQLASLAAQEVSPDELIVADDRSEDETLSIVESFARTAPFPVVIRRQRTAVGLRGELPPREPRCQR